MRIIAGGVLVFSMLALHACSSDESPGVAAPDASSGGSAGGGGSAGDAGPDAPADAPNDGSSEASTSATLRLDFERLKPGLSFRALVTAQSGGAPIKGQSISVTSTRGTVGPVTDLGNGTYAAQITPDTTGTGEYAVTASHAAWGASVTRNAVVLKEVGSRWGQPQAYAGLVNTSAWEDSLSISPDGEWLILEYIPVTISCLLEHVSEPTHPTCAKARGPWAAPERPAMPGASRIAADGTIHHGCPSLGLDPAPFAVPPATLYGFRRQPDGSFAEPFALSIDGVDGCVSAFGPSLVHTEPGKAIFTFAFDTPTDGDPPTGTAGDIFTMGIELGKPTVLGSFSGAALGMNAQLLGFSAVGHQGNPHLLSAGSTTQLWVDDETAAEKDLFVYQLTGAFPQGPWTGPIKLPPPISQPGEEDNQPFFDGSELLWWRGERILSSKHSGGALDAQQSWAAVATELAGDATASAPGTIRIVGEPTKGKRNGREVLSFVYVQNAPDGTLDINAGFVEEQP